MASQEIIEKRIAILKLIKQELQKSETFLDIDNPPNDNIEYGLGRAMVLLVIQFVIMNLSSFLKVQII